MSQKISEELYALAHSKKHDHFVDVLYDINEHTSIDTRQLEILIKLDFFSDFGNQRELLRIMGIFYDTFKRGEAKQIKKNVVDATQLEEIIKKYSIGTKKNGEDAKSYTLVDNRNMLREIEDAIIAVGMEDLPILSKVKYFKEAMGYIGYVSNLPEDRPKLYVLDVYPLKRKSDGRHFGYSIITKSIGSGIESRFTVMKSLYDKEPILKDSVIYCKEYVREGIYYRMTRYEKITQ